MESHHAPLAFASSGTDRFLDARDRLLILGHPCGHIPSFALPQTRSHRTPAGRPSHRHVLDLQAPDCGPCRLCGRRVRHVLRRADPHGHLGLSRAQGRLPRQHHHLRHRRPCLPLLLAPFAPARGTRQPNQISPSTAALGLQAGRGPGVGVGPEAKGRDEGRYAGPAPHAVAGKRSVGAAAGDCGLSIHSTARRLCRYSSTGGAFLDPGPSCQPCAAAVGAADAPQCHHPQADKLDRNPGQRTTRGPYATGRRQEASRSSSR